MDFSSSFALSPALKDFISGAVAGAFAITVSQPLDTVRVRIQQAALSGGQRDTLGVLISLVRKEGLLSPFKGLTYPLLFASVQSAILFQAYGWTLRQLAERQQQQQYTTTVAVTAQHQHTRPVSAQQHQNILPTPHQHQHQHQHPDHLPLHHLQTTTQPACQALNPGPPGSGALQSAPPSGGDPQTHGPLPPLPSIHQLHLHHHHHHALEQQQVSAVHGSHSVTGQVLAWAAGRMGLRPAHYASTAQHQHQHQPGAHAHKPELLAPLACDVTSGTPGAPAGGNHGCSAAAAAARGHGTQLEGRSYGPAPSSCGREGIPDAAGTGGADGPACRQQPQQQQQLLHEQRGQGLGQEGAALQSPAPTPLPTPWHGFLAGGVAGMAQVFLWSPVELLKLRAQLQTATPGSAGYRNPAALAAQVLRQDGVAGLYRGFTLTVVRDVPSYAMYFWLYHDIAGALSPGVHPEQAPPSTQVLAGGLAGVIAWLPIYPLDVLKTRVQAVTASASRGRGIMHYAREMYLEGGSRAFFRGISPTLVRAFMMDGASFLGYTTTLKLLGAAGAEEEGSEGNGRGGARAKAAAAGPA